MTEQTLHEHFPDLSILEFKILGTIAYHGEIPAKYHLRSLAHKSRCREEEVLTAVEKLRKSEYMEGEKVAPKHFFHVVDFVMKNVPQWEKTYAWLQTFRYDFSEYLWELGKLISQENWVAAAALKRPNSSTQAKRQPSMRMERYLAPILGQKDDCRLASVLIKDEVDSLVDYLLDSRLRENALTLDGLDEIRNIIDKSGMDALEYDDKLMMYRYFLQGGTPDWKSGRYTSSFSLKRFQPSSPWRPACKAIAKLYSNDFTGALGLFGEALKELDKESSVRGTFDNRILSFFYAICLLRCELSSVMTDQKITEVKDKFLKSRNVYYGKELAATRILLMYATFEHANCPEYVKGEVNRMIIEDNCPLTRIFGDILLGYFKCGQEVMSNEMPIAGILKHELSSYKPIGISEKKELAEAFGGKPLLPQIRRKDSWEIAFRDIRQNLIDSKQAEKRIIYFFDGLWLDNIVEQTRRDDGTWDAGISLSRKQFMNEGYGSMNDADRRIAAQMRVRVVDVPEAGIIFNELCGSDRLFVGQPYTQPFQPAEIEQEQPKITFKAYGDCISITSNVPYDRNKKLGNCIVKVIGDGKYSAIILNDLQRDILERILQTDKLPLHAAGEVRLLSERLDGIIDVESDLLLAESIQTVEGGGKIAIRITPEEKEHDYHVQMLAAPLPEGEIRYPAGEGDPIIYDQVDGKTTIVLRNLEAEQSNYEILHEFICEKIGDVFTDFMTARLSTSQSLLTLLEYAYEHQETFMLEWPRGRELKFKGIMKPADVDIQVSTNVDWFSIQGQVKIPGSTLSFKELLERYRDAEIDGYIQIGENEFMRMTQALKKHIEDLDGVINGSDKSTKSQTVGKYDVGALAEILGEDGGLHAQMDEGFLSLLSRMRNAYDRPAEVPATLNATLRDYQKEGYEWMARLTEWGAGACLADDMGLGKTVQTIALLLHRADKGASLIVAPKSLILNWEKEMQKFAPSLNVININSEKDKKSAIQKAAASDVVLTTYGVLVTQKDALTSKHWNTICLDEAHYIKNRMTRTSRAAMALTGEAKVILTGTPLQNHLGEMWNLFQFINPGMLGPWQQFVDKYIKSPWDELAQRELKDRTMPFILRRTKDEVLDDLPEKISYEQMVELTPEELQIYEKIRKDVEVKFKKHKTAEEKKLAKTLNISFFQELTRLRLLANSVSLVYPEWQAESSKIAALRDIVSSLGSRKDNKVLIFSQFTSFLAQVGQMMKDAGVDYLYLDGQTAMDERQRLVDEFQSGDSQFFLISLKAGGLGLNLTAANYVILMDPWWNPSIEDQATDRAHRIGQERNVTVIRLVSANTIEEKILKLHEDKQSLSDRILDGTSGSAALTMDEILDMVSPYR